MSRRLRTGMACRHRGQWSRLASSEPYESGCAARRGGVATMCLDLAGQTTCGNHPRLAMAGAHW